jgi:hypothetical protein
VHGMRKIITSSSSSFRHSIISYSDTIYLGTIYLGTIYLGTIYLGTMYSGTMYSGTIYLGTIYFCIGIVFKLPASVGQVTSVASNVKQLDALSL